MMQGVDYLLDASTSRNADTTPFFSPTAPLLLFNALHVARRVQDRCILLIGMGSGFVGLVVFLSLRMLAARTTVGYPPRLLCWVTTLPPSFCALPWSLNRALGLESEQKLKEVGPNGRVSLAAQYSNYLLPTPPRCRSLACTDPRCRTTLAGWVAVTQGGGMTAGPFFGGLLLKIGFPKKWFNGLTSPGWVMATIWVVFWEIELAPLPASGAEADGLHHCAIGAQGRVGRGRVNVLVRDVLVLRSRRVGGQHPRLRVERAPAEVDNNARVAALRRALLADGRGLIAAPLLLFNALHVARRVQDRYILLIGMGSGFVGLVVFLSLRMLAPRTTVGTVTLSLMSKTLPPSVSVRPWSLKLGPGLEGEQKHKEVDLNGRSPCSIATTADASVVLYGAAVASRSACSVTSD
ncbi:hypothetical protein AURDEDRAFT_186757 [Auricularia subglabra TFB-10046 SS5]|uniref:Uncharacterized protein n=1 Tax=Auricularia subglabra (strain TFB-10046 / SS5) TaxID=717982 RepID=J0DD06_AURST|nr:hypothetical protein AURDEDRAFT_186757 [Auricularia subglabra TFB-10046 SS5]